MKSVLIVDDDLVVREILRLRFEEAGYHVMESSDGSEVASILEEKPVDLLVIDVFMPEKGGLETLIELSAKGVRFKTIVITGHDRTDADHFKGLLRQFGVTHVFRKPLDYEALLQAASELTT